MKLLRLHAYYEPEVTAGSHLIEDFDCALAREGIEAEYYTPIPCRGVDEAVRRQYRTIKYEEKYDGKIRVHRYWLPYEGRNKLLRALRYVLSNVIGYAKGVCAKDVDVVYASSTPPTQGMLSALVAKRLSRKYGRQVAFCYHVQDLFPESLVSTGICTEKSVLYRIGRKISKFAYDRADVILAISQDMKKRLMESGVAEEKIQVVYNWIDTDSVRPVPREDNRLFDELEIPRDKQCVTYAGNLGLSQGVETILQAAKLLEQEADILFVIFGGGSEFAHYRQRIENEGYANIRIFPLQPLSRVSEVYSLGAASIVSCKKGVGLGALPSKTWSIMAAQTPVILSFDEDTELRRIVEEHDAGVFGAAEDAEALTQNILRLCRDAQDAARMGQNARNLVEAEYSASANTKKITKILRDAAEHAVREE